MGIKILQSVTAHALIDQVSSVLFTMLYEMSVGFLHATTKMLPSSQV